MVMFIVTDVHLRDIDVIILNGCIRMRTAMRIRIGLVVDFTEIFDGTRWIVENFRKMETIGKRWDLEKEIMQ